MIIHIQVEKAEPFGFKAVIDANTGLYATGETIQDAVLKARAVAFGWLSTAILIESGIKPDDSNSITFTVHVPKQDPLADRPANPGKIPMQISKEPVIPVKPATKSADTSAALKAAFPNPTP